ncbi:CHAT domain-containing protein [Cyclobacteriaceae bacterium]|nr:CHAT domain-containing protein [Cyclobacteriaceae bacterium]
MRSGIFIIFSLLVYAYCQAQNIPENSNSYDKKGRKIGTWTNLFDQDFAPTDNLDSVEYYRIISYKNGLPDGFVYDYYINGNIQWEGILLSDEPEDIIDGEHIYYQYENLRLSAIEVYDDDDPIKKSFFNRNGDVVMDVSYDIDRIPNFSIYEVNEDTSAQLTVLSGLLDIIYEYYAFEGITLLDASLELLRIGKLYYDEFDKDFIGILDNLYMAYVDNNNFEKALKVILDICEKEKQIYGVESHRYIQSLNLLLTSYMDIGEYSKAIEIGIEGLKKAEISIGKKSEVYSLITNNLSLCYRDLGNMPEALNLQLQSKEVRKDLYGVQSPEYLTSINNLAIIYSEIGDQESAKLLSQEALNITLNMDNTGESRLKLALLNSGNPEKALEIYRRDSIYSNNYTMALVNVAYGHLENYRNFENRNSEKLLLSKELLLEAYDMSVKLRVDNVDRNRLDILNVLRETYGFLSLDDDNYDLFWQKALNISDEISKIIEDKFGESSINDVGQKIKDAIFFAEFSGAPNHYKFEKFITGINGFIELYIKNESFLTEYLMREYNSELLRTSQYLFDFKPKSKITFNTMSFLKGRDLNNRMSLNRIIYNTQDSILKKSYNEWVNVNKEITKYYENLSKRNSNKADEIIKLIEYSENLEKNIKSKFSKNPSSLNYLYQFNVEGRIKTKNLVENQNRIQKFTKLIKLDSNDTELFLDRGYARYSVGDLEGAKNDYLQVIKIEPLNDWAYYNLAFTTYELGEINKAIDALEKAISLNKLNSEYYRLSGLIKQNQGNFNDAIKDYNISLKIEPENIQTYFNRGNAFQELGKFNKAIDAFSDVISFDPDNSDAYYNRGNAYFSSNNYQSAIDDYYNSLRYRPNQTDAYDNIADAYHHLGNHEKVVQIFEYARQLEQDKLFDQYSLYSFDDVVSRLDKDDIYIGIIKGLFEEPSLELGVESYFAYVIKKGDTIPDVVYLNSEEVLNRVYTAWSNHIYSKENPAEGKRYSELLWGPLSSFIKTSKNIYYNSEGIYSKINPNVLYDESNEAYIMDQFNIIQISSLEDFVKQKDFSESYSSNFTDKSAVIFGNPTFSLGQKQLESIVKAETREINETSIENMRGTLIEDLPGTEIEVDQISDILKNNGWSVDVNKKYQANEENLKSIKHPSVLHIATHGYFLKNDDILLDPLMKSGLLLSGAENTRNGEVIGSENGWLNALETSFLDLRGTELVVLSACETGSGEIENGKGVFGLQRAIQLAGAESIIMSMWKVDDNATKDLMIEFYTNWLDRKMTKRAAFRQAQLDIREKYVHPYYWGAFVMLGK